MSLAINDFCQMQPATFFAFASICSLIVLVGDLTNIISYQFYLFDIEFLVVSPDKIGKFLTKD